MSKTKKQKNRDVMKRVICLILALAMILTILLSTVIAMAAESETFWPSGISVGSQSAIVIEASTGTVLYEKNADEVHYPASITKILTGLVAVENSQMDEEVTFSRDAVAQSRGGTSSIARDVDEVMTMEQCLYGMMLESANECAYAIAEHVGGGDINVFLKMMNDKAKELGCTNTHFVNPNGLPSEDHYTSARDMALIGQAALNNETLAQIMATKTYQIPPTNKHTEITPLNNHHAMLNFYKTSKYLYDGCLGGKTGYTDAARNTLVTFAERDGMKLVCVVMCAEKPYHYEDTTNLFDYCFANFKVEDVSNLENLFSNQSEDSIGVLAENIDLIETKVTGNVVLPKTVDTSEVRVSVEPTKNEKDPSIVGRVIYTYGNRQVGVGDLMFTGAGEYNYPFYNIDEEKGGSGIAYYKLNFVFVIEIILAVILGIAVLFLLFKGIDRLISKAYRFRASHKRYQPKYKTIKRKKRRRGKRRR